MASPADHFTRLQKIAIFLIVIGEERTREILADLDVDTIEQLNAAIAGLGQLTPHEKAAVMIEFGDMFYKDIPLKAKLEEPDLPTPPSPPSPTATQVPTESQATTESQAPPLPSPPPPPPPPTPSKEDEEAIRSALQQLRRRVDPGKVDWGRAGYDFGEGFRGPEGRR